MPARLAPKRRVATPFLLGVALTLASCMYFPSYVGGVPSGDPWSAMPLRGWLLRDGIVAEAVTGCFTPDCPQQVAVGLFRATGAQADQLARLIEAPEPLAWSLRDAPPRPGTTAPRPATSFEIDRAPVRGLPGFQLAMIRADGMRKPVYVRVAGRRERDVLRFLMVFGADRDAVAHVADNAVLSEFR